MTSRPFVKICGLTRLEDARAAHRAGADAVGINLWPGSRRFVPPGARDWLRELPPALLRLAVMVDPSPAEAEAALREPWCDGIQLHGAETPEFCAVWRAAGFRVWKAVRVRDEESLAESEVFPPDLPLVLDAFDPAAPGGTGRLAPWDLAARFVASHPERRVVLAGGLTPENVSAGVEVVRPWGVDVAGGVEQAGTPSSRKNADRMRAFVAAARELEK